MVTETRAVDVKYTVVAKSRSEAMQKAAIGDTIDEVDVKQLGVQAREVDGSTLRLAVEEPTEGEELS
jgi:hypothetical protein